jgi:hypothetical protein
MKCPEDKLWLSLELGEVTQNEARALEEHEAHCVTCKDVRRAQRTLLDDLAAPPELGKSEDAFVAQVMGACERSATAPAPAPAPGWRSWQRWGAVVAVAAGVTLWMARPHAPTEIDGVVARGSGRHVGPVSVEVLRIRGTAAVPIEGASLAPGDGIAVRYWNTSSERRFLAVFALDAGETVHWIHPAYLDPSSNPTSIALRPSAQGELLDEVVEPERPAFGPLRVVALLSREPISVRTVEGRLATKHRSIAELFPAADVLEWRCSWDVR